MSDTPTAGTPEPDAGRPRGCGPCSTPTSTLHFPRFDQHDWAGEIGAPVEVVVPLVVLEELDRHKNQGKPVLGDRAAGVARRIEDLVEEHGGRVDDRLSVVLALEPDGHVRRPTVDAEIVAVAAALVAEPGPPVVVVTDDAGLRAQARARPDGPPAARRTAAVDGPGGGQAPQGPAGGRQDPEGPARRQGDVHGRQGASAAAARPPAGQAGAVRGLGREPRPSRSAPPSKSRDGRRACSGSAASTGTSPPAPGPPAGTTSSATPGCVPSPAGPPASTNAGCGRRTRSTCACADATPAAPQQRKGDPALTMRVIRRLDPPIGRSAVSGR